MSTAPNQVADVDTEGTDVCASLAAYPEDAHVALVIVLDQLSLVDGPNTELLLDGRDERGPLEARTLERVKSFLKLLDLIEALMQLDNSNVLFTSGLLSFDESGSVVNADDKAASDLRVKGTRVASLVDLEDFLDPGDNLMRGWVGGLVQVNHTVLFEHVNWTVKRGETAGQRSKVRRFHV